MITGQPDTRRSQFADAAGKLVVGFHRLILSQITCCRDNIDVALLRFYGVQHCAIAAKRIHA
ncbi:hypothetical protein D3C80_2017510 [compost metagenome]